MQGGYLNVTVTWAVALGAPAAATFIEKGADPSCGGPEVMYGPPVAVKVPVTTEPACALTSPAVTAKWHWKGPVGERKGQRASGGSVGVAVS